MHAIVHRWAVLLLALGACDAPAPAADPAPPAWVYAPPSTGWPLGRELGRIGRAQAPQAAPLLGISGPVPIPLRLATPWSVPGEGPARAVIYGLEGVKPAIELIDLDAGRVVWRDTEACAGPVVGVTPEAIVCAGADGVRGVSLDGKAAWRSQAPFVAITGEHVVVGPTGEAVILDPGTGDELSRVRLPAGVLAESIIASCGDAGRELFATGPTGELIRIADAKGGPAVTWSVPVGAIADLDACEGETVLVEQPGDGGSQLIAIARPSGAELGRVDGVRGYWRARDGSARLEISIATGVGRWSRALVAEDMTTLPSFGPLLAARGDRRLVRSSSHTAVVLDRAGVRAYVPFAMMGAVLGDRTILGASWVGSPAESVRRFGIPARYRRVLRLPARTEGVAVPTELRDLPEVRPLVVDGAIALPDTAKHGTVAVALDRASSEIVYAAVLEAPARDSTHAGVVAADLARRTWSWQRTDGCGPGTPLALAVARDVIVCAARGTTPGTATVRATTRTGIPAWEWEGDAVDGVQAAGDTVLAHAADRAIVLDAATGRVRGRLVSDDGADVRAAVLVVDGAPLVVAVERGRLVARLPRAGMLPVWSLAIDGVVQRISASGAGVLVELEDGDAARVDGATGTAVVLPGLGLTWAATGDLITGATVGGPLPGHAAPGQPSPVGESWQLSLYELTGGVRARNDYGLTGTIAPARPRGPAGSPLAVTYGATEAAVLVIDPRTGDPLRRIALPEDAPRGAVFSTIVDGSPVAGVVLARPLRIVLF